MNKNLINMNINPETRIVWCNQEAKDTWQKPIFDLSQKIQDLEVESVVRNHRPCSWQTILNKDLPKKSKEYNEKGLIVTPIRDVAIINGFSHVSLPVGKNDTEYNVYCIISKNIKDANEFRGAHFAGDHITQGDLLGFPRCCSSFFSKVWEQGYFDPILQVYENSKRYHPYSNPILRYIGLRIGFHFPCSFHCERTIRIAEERIEMISKEDRIILDSLLSLPMEWDCYHGIAIVRTPIFYIITGSIPLKKKYKIQIDGNFIPMESSYGNVFPFIRRNHGKCDRLGLS